MSYADDNPGYRLDSEEQARNWILELVEGVKVARLDCNVVFPGDAARSVAHQRKAYHQFLVRHGAALGTLTAVHRCGKLGDVAYSELREVVLNTLAPTIVGASG